MKCLALPIAVLAAGMIATRSDASSITTAVSAPSGNVEISSPTTDGSWEQLRKTNTTTNWIELGQTFTVTTAFTLDKISLLINQDAALTNQNLPLEVTLFSAATVASTSGTNLAGYPDAGVGPTTAFATGTNLWMTFDVADVALSPGIYGFKVGFSGATNSSKQLGDTGVGLNGVAHDVDVYAGGQMFRLRPPPTASAGYDDNDLTFSIQSVPEPSACLLASICAIALVGYGIGRHRD
jgi:hypothetical protein